MKHSSCWRSKANDVPFTTHASPPSPGPDPPPAPSAVLVNGRLPPGVDAFRLKPIGINALRAAVTHFCGDRP